MSILIKGLNMPKDIAPNVHQTITLIISGDGTIYDVNRNQLPYEVVEINGSYGRLIDADALPVKDLDSNGWLNAFGVAVEDLENAPTVIEAEGEDVNITD